MSIGELLALSRRNDELEKEADRLTGIWIEAKDEANVLRQLDQQLRDEITRLKRIITGENRCPCGAVIFADTEEWEVPLCYNCYEEKTSPCYCKDGIRGRYCVDYHVKPSSPG